MTRLLLLRPEPGAAATCGRAAALGLDALATPLFTVRPLAWQRPEGAIDAVLLTSANAARHGGGALAALTSLPAYAVGEATARAAREVGFGDVRVASGDGAAALALIEAERPGRVLHLAGREHIALDSARIAVERRLVYAADAADALPDTARAAIAGGAIVLLHSPRAAALFRKLSEDAGIVPASVAIAALSAAVAASAGPGWRDVAVAATPDEDALLAAAARLCDKRVTS